MKNRIKEIRLRQGLTQEKIAEVLGKNKSQISKLENGGMELTSSWLEALAGVLHCRPQDLIADDDAPGVPVVGYVGAGARVECVDSCMKGAGLEEVEAPFGSNGRKILAVRVRGDSMLPMLEDGWLIFYQRDGDGVPPKAIGRLCVVKLPDETILVKKLRQGSKAGFYHLISHNSDAMFDQELLWASPVIDIRPS